VNAVLKEPQVREALLKQGLVTGGGTAEQFGRFIADEGKRWGEIIKRLRITIE
jgi:tripartite-type tricarboxylate transporter receptor subunit TctC